jgi:hypothetical protein
LKRCVFLRVLPSEKALVIHQTSVAPNVSSGT